MVKLLSGEVSAKIDEELMGEEYGFSVDQLMELAGLAVAKTCHRQHPPQSNKKVLILVGPGSTYFLRFSLPFFWKDSPVF